MLRGGHVELVDAAVHVACACDKGGSQQQQQQQQQPNLIHPPSALINPCSLLSATPAASASGIRLA